MDVVSLFVFIVFLRIFDVSMGVLRTIFLIRGKRTTASLLGFAESLLWVVAISNVTRHIDKPVYMVAFALGFSLGNFIGLSIERKLALGEQVLRAFTRKGPELAGALRQAGFAVTTFVGEGKDGPIDLLMVKLKRKKVRQILEVLQANDPQAFYFLDDITELPQSKAGPQRLRVPFRAARWLSPFRRK